MTRGGCWLSSSLWAGHHHSEPHPLYKVDPVVSLLVDEKTEAWRNF